MQYCERGGRNTAPHLILTHGRERAVDSPLAWRHPKISARWNRECAPQHVERVPGIVVRQRGDKHRGSASRDFERGEQRVVARDGVAGRREHRTQEAHARLASNRRAQPHFPLCERCQRIDGARDKQRAAKREVEPAGLRASGAGRHDRRELHGIAGDHGGGPVQ